MNTARRQVDHRADRLEAKPTVRQLDELHSPSPLLLLSPKADTHFTMLRRVEG